MSIALTVRERQALEAIVAHTADVCQLKHAQVILALADDLIVSQVVRNFQVAHHTIYNWIDRFRQPRGTIAQRLANSHRSGGPACFSSSRRPGAGPP